MGVRGWNAVGVFGAPPYISSQIFVKEPTPITKDRESVFSQFLFWRDLWSNPLSSTSVGFWSSSKPR